MRIPGGGTTGCEHDDVAARAHICMEGKSAPRKFAIDKLKSEFNLNDHYE